MSMGVSKEQALEDACKVEHDISEETFEAIKKAFRNVSSILEEMGLEDTKENVQTALYYGADQVIMARPLIRATFDDHYKETLRDLL